MTDVKTILVGTVGQGIMRSADGGENWGRIGIGAGLHSDAMVRTLLNTPTSPEIIFAGTDKGLVRSDDAGKTWHQVDSPTPAALFRSSDAGKTWEKSSMEAAAECPNVGVPRVTGIAVDPMTHNDVWVGLEVDGLRHSSDGGDTWETINGAIPNPDVHNVAVAGGPPKTVVVVVNNDVYTSTDNGGNWDRLGIKEVFPYTYPRGILVQPGNSNNIFVTIGDSTPGRVGTVMRSQDTGKTWESLPLPVEPNSAMWVVNAQAAEPQVMFAGSRYGYMYRSEDSGDSWTKLWREFSEISSVLWVPE